MNDIFSKIRKFLYTPVGSITFAVLCLVMWHLFFNVAFNNKTNPDNFNIRQEKIESKNDLGFTFMDFVKKYNVMVTAKSFGPNYEKYEIRVEGLSDKNVNEKTFETHCKLDDWTTIIFDQDMNTKKVIEVTVSTTAFDNNVRVGYLGVVANAIHIVNGHSSDIKNCDCGVIVKSLDIVKRLFLNERHYDEVSKGKFKYTLTVVPMTSANCPHLFFTIKSKD